MGVLISTLNYPVVIKYGSENMVISPFQVIKNVDLSKVGKPLPNGILVKERNK